MISVQETLIQPVKFFHHQNVCFPFLDSSHNFGQSGAVKLDAVALFSDFARDCVAVLHGPTPQIVLLVLHHRHRYKEPKIYIISSL